MKNLSEKEILKAQQKNQKLYQFYKMVSWDLLFYYAIVFLFLTQTKGFSTAQYIFAEAFYPLFKIISQIPCTILVQKIGKKNSLIIGNLFLFAFVLVVMGLNSVTEYIIANFICAIAFTTKSLAEPNLLYDSIENTENKRTIFSKIDGHGSSLYYYLNAITAAISGFLFVVNPYIPLVLSLLFTFIAVILSYQFTEIQNSEELHTATKKSSFMLELRNYIGDLKQAFRFILKSKRLRSLILFNAIFVSFIVMVDTLRRSVLTELNVPNEYFGIIFALYGILSGFFSNSATKIHKTHGNHTLSFLSMTYCISVILTGLTAILSGLPPFLLYFLVLTLFAVNYVIPAPYYTLIKQYLGSFATSTLRTQITSANLFLESLTRTLVAFLVSFLTDNISSALSTFILGILFIIILLIILSYMKTRVGLKPEEYSNSDIKFNELY